MTESEMYEKEIQQLNKQLYTAYGKLAALSMVEDSWQETKPMINRGLSLSLLIVVRQFIEDLSGQDLTRKNYIQ